MGLISSQSSERTLHRIERTQGNSSLKTGFWVQGSSEFNNGFHSLTGEFQSPYRKYIAHVNHATNANLMLFIVQGEPTFLQLAHVSFQVLIMLFVICTNNSQIIMEVICTWAVSNHLPHNLFIVAMFTQKSSYRTCTSHYRSSKSCNVSRIWVQLNLMKDHI